MQAASYNKHGSKYGILKLYYSISTAVQYSHVQVEFESWCYCVSNSPQHSWDAPPGTGSPFPPPLPPL